MNSEWKVLVADMVGKGKGRGRWMVGVVLWVHIGGVRSSALPRLAIEAESLLGAGYVEYIGRMNGVNDCGETKTLNIKNGLRAS